jgi:5-methylcytosine-specific restriction endonuclease McrA
MAGEFRLRSWLINALRSSFRRYPPFYRTKNAVKEEYYVPSKSGRPMRRVRFTCAQCGGKYANTAVSVDHKVPIVPETGFPTLPDGTDDWNTYIRRLYCTDDGLQVLCKECHNGKTQVENKTRREMKKDKQ